LAIYVWAVDSECWRVGMSVCFASLIVDSYNLFRTMVFSSCSFFFFLVLDFFKVSPHPSSPFHHPIFRSSGLPRQPFSPSPNTLARLPIVAGPHDAVPPRVAAVPRNGVGGVSAPPHRQCTRLQVTPAPSDHDVCL